MFSTMVANPQILRSTVLLEADGFGGDLQHVNQSGSRVHLSRWQVMHALALVGKGHWGEVFRKKLGLVEAFKNGVDALLYLEDTAAGLCLSPAFRSLDLSEKTAVSYRFGMAFTKWACELILGIPYLIHADRLIAEGRALTDPQSKRRGDLLGLDLSGRWHVVEAKGRSHEPEVGLADEAKQEQAARILRVDGNPPRTKCACLVLTGRKPVNVWLRDPEDDGESLTKYDVPRSAMIESQLAPFLEATREGRRRRVAGFDFIVGDPAVRYAVSDKQAAYVVRPALVASIAYAGAEQQVEEALRFASSWAGERRQVPPDQMVSISANGTAIVAERV